MGGMFACPECGHELAVKGFTPGREILCPMCSTLVEVPYLPRVAGRSRGKRRRKRPAWWDSKLLWSAVGFAAIALGGLAVGRIIGTRARSDRERVLNELVASADRAETQGNLAAALYQIEAAVAVARARTTAPAGSSRLAELLARRDRASLREATARLAAVDGLAPDPAVGESETLARRARTDPALAPLAEAISAKVEESRRRQVDGELGAARQALAAGNASGAFVAAERFHDHAGLLAGPDARRFQDEARGLLATIVERHGVIAPPVAGRFLAGSAGAYDAALDRPLAESLQLRGYLVQPRQSPWQTLWDEHAPFRASIQVAETQDGLYLQSKNRTTQIDGVLELTYRGRSIWQARVVARTRMPLPDLPAYLAGRLATANHRDPEVEHRLQTDALLLFTELAARHLRGLPGWESATKGL